MKGRKIKKRGMESEIIISETAKKFYNSNYYQWNAIYNRHPFIPRSRYFVKVIREFNGGIEMERLGEPVGTQERLEYKGEDLKKWLISLQKELKRLGIKHRDIHPANILRSGKSFKLIDFYWVNTEKWESGLNNHYSPHDEEAIKKLLNEIDK